MPGFMQFITGAYLLIGLTWFNVFGNAAPLYMAGLAFTAYGIHWFAMAHRRYIDSSAEPDGWMAIAFLFISILGVDVFRRTEIPTRLFSWSPGGRLVGFFQFVTGIWLMYCTYAWIWRSEPKRGFRLSNRRNPVGGETWSKTF